MDEPTASLTQREVEALFEVIRELRSTGVGIIYISHRLQEIFALADRVTVLRDGESVGFRELRQGGERSGTEEPISEAELIRLMVGREMTHSFPAPCISPGSPVLSLARVGCALSGVHDVTLDIRAGEIVGLAGLIGAGRTELARILFGVTPNDSGEIVLNGHRVAIRSPGDAIAQGIAYVPEDRRRHGVVLDLPISHNVTMAIHRKIFRGAWLQFRAERELTHHFTRQLGVRAAGPDAPAGTLSGGNQQKIALARWLAANPKVLILDEPTQGVDVGAKSEIHRIIRSLANDGLAVLMISSDLPEIVGLSDRIAVMRNGTIAATLPAKSAPHEIMKLAVGQRTVTSNTGAIAS